MGYSGARGTLIYETNLKAKISCQTPFNGQMRIKVHTAPTAPLVLHRTGIHKRYEKNSVSMAECGINFFLLSSIVFHL